MGGESKTLGEKDLLYEEFWQYALNYNCPTVLAIWSRLIRAIHIGKQPYSREELN